MTITKSSFRSGPLKDYYAHAVKVGNILYLAGQVGMDAAGTIGSDIVTQTDLAYRNIQSVLARFDATMENVVDETWFVTDVSEVMANAEAIFSARAKLYGGIPEVTQTLVQVSALIFPGLKIEIKCIAHL